MKIGAQLYTVRDFIRTPEEVETAFARIESIGFRCVQVSGMGPIEAEQLRDIAVAHQQEIIITHTNPDRIINDTENVIKEHKIFGCSHVGIGAMHPKYQGSIAGARQFIADFLPAAKLLHENGMKLHYHNHAFEFERHGGKIIYDLLIEETDPALFGFIPDTYWIQYGGRCPARQLEALKGRVEVCHFKDMKIVSNQPKMAPVMDGNLSWGEIFDACQATEIPYAMIEQDDTGEMDPFDALARSYQNLMQVFGK